MMVKETAKPFPRIFMSDSLPELVELERIIDSLGERARVRELTRVETEGQRFPLYSIALGSTEPTAPTLAIVGGVHGLERIGSKVVLAYLRTLARLVHWDDTVHQLLDRSRLLFVPIVNPAGMFRHTRCNANGVDLMRNAPIEAEDKSNIWLAGGHRLSPKLPWYRGAKDAPMEAEAQALCQVIRQEVLCSPLAVTMDVHSGYGVVDRLWFPYAKNRKPFPHLAEAFALKELLDDTYPHHVYRVEPQSHQYVTHGDLWDYLYDEHRAQHPQRLFLPLSLEMGSWLWVKKNPRQLFSLLGAFNPLLPHRRARTLRRHITLFDFLHRAVVSSKAWATFGAHERESKSAEAREHWYGKAA